ncbi:MAG: glycosyl hydrolase family 16 [Balneola sp.]
MKRILIVFLVLPVLFAGCERSVDGLSEPTLTQNPEVFIDGFSSGLDYLPFGDSKLDAFSVDEETTFDGSGASMRFDVPNVGDPTGAYAGAIFKDLNGGRDLTPYNALTFYAKATRAGTINEIGFGNDFEQSPYRTIIQGLRLSTSWKKYVIPIPDPSKLTEEQGMFWYAEGPEGESGEGYTFWIDELQYEYLPTLAQPRPFIKNGSDETGAAFVGQDLNIDGVGVTFNYAFETAGDVAVSQDITVNTTSNFFDFNSSNSAVAVVDGAVVSVVGPGDATITANLNGVDATGSISVSSIDLAPTPTRAAEDVIAIFSDPYTNRPVDYFNGYWTFSTTQGQDDIEVNGNNVIKYSQLNFVGIEFQGANSIDASEMTHFHIDVYVENIIQAGDFMEIRIVDFGPNGVFGGDDTQRSFFLNASSNPPISNGGWISIEIPLPSTKANMSQIIFVTEGTNPNATGSITDVLIDNMYFYK